MVPSSNDHCGPALPWWRVPVVWLVIGGPLVVVIAAIATAVIAVRGADVVVRAPAPPAQATRHDAPALQARNHAQTPAPR